MLGQQLVRLRQGLRVGLRKLLQQPAIHQEASLRGVAEHVHPGVLRRQRDAGEIHVRRDVLQPHVGQRVGVGTMRAVAHQRAAAALRVVVLGLGEAVVDEEGGAALHPRGQRGDEGLGLRMQLGLRIGHEGAVVRGAQGTFAVGEDEAFAVRRSDAALGPALAVEMQQLHRHRVEQLVADDDAVQRVGPGVEPLNTIGVGGQALALPLAQRAGQVDDVIAAHAVAEALEQLRGQRAGAGTELIDLVALAGVQRLPHLHGERAAEQRRQLRRGHKIAARRGHGAELRGRVGVVAQPRRVQRQRHEAVEGQPAAGLGNGLADVPRQPGR